MEETEDGLWLCLLSPQASFYQMCSSSPSSPTPLSPLWNFSPGNNLQGLGGTSSNIISPQYQRKEEREEEMEDESWFSLLSPLALSYQMCSSLPSSPSPLSPPWNFCSENNLQGSGGTSSNIISSRNQTREEREEEMEDGLQFKLPSLRAMFNQMCSSLPSSSSGKYWIGFQLLLFSEEKIKFGNLIKASNEAFEEFQSHLIASIKKHLRRHVKISEGYVDVIPTLEAPLPVIETLNDESIQQASENGSMAKRSLYEDELRRSGELVRTKACSAEDGKMCDSGRNLRLLENCQTERHSKKRNVKGAKQLNKERILPFLSLKLVDAAKELGVSRSTLKRKCRKIGIKHWPSDKRRAGNATVLKNTDVFGSCNEPNKGDIVNQCMPLSCSLLEVNETNQPPPNTSLATDKETTKTKQSKSEDNGLGEEANASLRPVGSSSSFVVKAEYKEDIIRLVLSRYSVAELKEEIQKRLNLKVGKFKIKYHDDDDDDRVLMTCDSDLQHALCVSRLSSAKFLRLLILDLV